MTGGGWIFMIGSWGIVTAMCVVCLRWTLSVAAPSGKEGPSAD